MRARRRPGCVAALVLVPGCALAPDPGARDAGLEESLPAALHDVQDRLLEEVVSRLEVAR